LVALVFQLPASFASTFQHFCTQATVGAGLPVIATLKHLIDTGDKIVKVQYALNPKLPAPVRCSCITTPALLDAASCNAHKVRSVSCRLPELIVPARAETSEP
jgi:hypothetical protein